MLQGQQDRPGQTHAPRAGPLELQPSAAASMQGRQAQADSGPGQGLRAESEQLKASASADRQALRGSCVTYTCCAGRTPGAQRQPWRLEAAGAPLASLLSHVCTSCPCSSQLSAAAPASVCSSFCAQWQQPQHTARLPTVSDELVRACGCSNADGYERQQALRIWHAWLWPNGQLRERLLGT